MAFDTVAAHLKLSELTGNGELHGHIERVAGDFGLSALQDPGHADAGQFGAEVRDLRASLSSAG